ncbi:phosphotriesterase-related protein [Macrosteles quadrilineatus]|uniref:phosphotriesterase-related protein n=1 Tax=Macrosteles quadrilineatus TaxID=74068 RepID=UPI0023E1362E|nr:phosphotriesterase-related protein [Macrosteles quadrilineatus]
MTAQTVTGPVPVSQLGRTLTHEHFNIDFHQFYSSPPAQLSGFFEGGITLENVGYVKQWPYSSKYNLDFSGKEVENAVVEEMKLYHKFGGGTVVENSNIGLNRNTSLLVRASKESGVNVIAGTGYYVEVCQPAGNLKLSVEAMSEVMLQELTEGCVEDTTVKCGFIGEVGSSWPITEFEKRAIVATAEVQQMQNCAVSFHPGRDSRAPFEIMRIYLEAGGDKNRAIMSHLDRTLTEDKDLLEFAKLGCFCQFDLFGTECSFYQLNPSLDMLSDAQRVDKIVRLITEGRTAQILMSHDIHTKHRLVHFGGHGFSHILNNITPKMLIKKISQKTIDDIFIKNPAAWLCGPS